MLTVPLLEEPIGAEEGPSVGAEEGPEEGFEPPPLPLSSLDEEFLGFFPSSSFLVLESKPDYSESSMVIGLEAEPLISELDGSTSE